MHHDRDAPIPKPLRDWLAGVNEAKRATLSQGFRLTITGAREALDTITRRFVTECPFMPLIRDDVIPGPSYLVPVRIYHPQPDQALPVALFVHGGGHVAGGAALYDPIARKLALFARRVVVSVEYRLAPECPYPAGLQDVMASAKRVMRLLSSLNIKHVARLALVGDSGGGALCATLAHLSQYDPGLELDQQVLLYPSLDYTLSQPSVSANGEGYLLERDRILWMFDAYFQHAENRKEVSPLFMETTERYPATLVVTAGFDPLRDEGIAYSARLKAAGIRCEHVHRPGMVHAFLNLEDLTSEDCRLTYEAIGDFLSA
jgi:acetyl esterase/lipase